MARADHDSRGPIVAWAQSHPSGYRDEFRFVQQVMKDVRARMEGPVVLRLYGWQEDDDMRPVEELREAGIDVQLMPFLHYSSFIPSLTEVAVGLCPLERDSLFSRGKSFGKILGYLDAKVPVIASDMADHSVFFSEDCGIISDDKEVWVDSIIRLLRNPQDRQRMADRAFDEFKARLTDSAAAGKVDAFLTSCLR